MLRFTPRVLGFVYCSIMDESRLEEVKKFGPKCVVFSSKIDLGAGVNSVDEKAFKVLANAFLKKYSVRGEAVTRVMHKDFREAHTIHANEKYVVVGNMHRGYIKGDRAFGARLSGYCTHSPKLGMKWVGEE